MRVSHLVAGATAFLIIGGCTDASTPLDPAGADPVPLSAPAEASSMAGPVQAAGEYDAIVDFSTLTLTPRGRNCRLVVDGRLVFTGTIVGTAAGTTSALVFAPCSDVATTPPGTFRDVFTSRLEFVGTIDGEPARAHVLYQGETQVGGRIEGHIHMSNGVSGVLDVDAQVAVGGAYDGQLVVH